MGIKGVKDPVTGLSPQMERFCQYIVDGKTLAEASNLAGYDGHTANASRRLSHPKIKARVDEIRAQRAASLAMRQEHEKVAVHKQFQDDGINLAWLVAESKANLLMAREKMDVKGANDTVKLMAQLLGYLGNAGMGDKKKPDDETPKPVQPINLQILNQVVERLGNDARGQPQALEAVTVSSPTGTLPTLPDLRSLVSVERGDGSDGEDDDAVYEPLEGDGSEESERLR